MVFLHCGIVACQTAFVIGDQDNGIRNNQGQRDDHRDKKPKGHKVGEQFSSNKYQKHGIIT